MADSSTSNFGLILPEVTGSLDTWGGKLNDNFVDLDALLREFMPVGVIFKWSGSAVSVPTGWTLCDGTNGTPDLRDRFVVATGSTYSLDDTGGVESVSISTSQIPSHNHTGSTNSGGSHSHSGSTSVNGDHLHTGSTGTAGGHNHSYARYQTLQNEIGSGGDVWLGLTTQTTSSAGAHIHDVFPDFSGSHSHSISTGSGGNHSHSLSISNTGLGEAHENRPAYYSLAYIMLLPEST